MLCLIKLSAKTIKNTHNNKYTQVCNCNVNYTKCTVATGCIVKTKLRKVSTLTVNICMYVLLQKPRKNCDNFVMNPQLVAKKHVKSITFDIFMWKVLFRAQ